MKILTQNADRSQFCEQLVWSTDLIDDDWKRKTAKNFAKSLMLEVLEYHVE
jgi:hypothetical protein